MAPLIPSITFLLPGIVITIVLPSELLTSFLIPQSNLNLETLHYSQAGIPLGIMVISD